MKYTYLAIFTIFMLIAEANTQHLHNMELLASYTQEELNSQSNFQALNGADYYKMTYYTTGSDGQADTASGLVTIPDNQGVAHSLVIYHHGTSPEKSRAPSNLNLETSSMAVLTGATYAVLAPDYLGMGESRGFHPYVHRETQASASIDMLKAFEEWVNEGNAEWNGKLFLTGYSQGGHASMSTHWELETNYSSEYEVTAAAHLSGPYSISTVMRNQMFSEEDYNFVGYIPYAILGYQEVYGDVYDNLNEIFRSMFIDAIEDFYEGEINLVTLTTSMLFTQFFNFGNRHPVNIFNPGFVSDVMENPDHPLNVILRDNDTYDWAPQSPTRIFYCQADDQVPFENSLFADSVMQENGSVDLETVDVGPGLNHSGCVQPATLATLNFFLGFQETSVVETELKNELLVFPNPTQGEINIELPDHRNDFEVLIFDLSGKLLISRTATNRIDLSALQDGMYILKIKSETDLISELIHLAR